MLIAALVPIVLAGSMPRDAVTVSASIGADALEVGKKYTMAVNWAVADGFSAAGAGIPAPILQIQVPKCAKLTGKVLKKYADLAKNEFLQEPFERLLKDPESEVEFKLVKEPDADDRFFLNFVAYVGDNDGKDSYFVRRRISLTVHGGATGEAVDATTSDWGKNRKLLQIGDKARKFQLPKADGSTVSLSSYLGEKNIIVTAYRAYW